jgi:hypothetical protein
MNSTERLQLPVKHNGYIVRQLSAPRGVLKNDVIALKDAKGQNIVVTDSSRLSVIPNMPQQDLDDLLRAHLVTEDTAASTQSERVYKLTPDGLARGAV